MKLALDTLDAMNAGDRLLLGVVVEIMPIFYRMINGRFLILQGMTGIS
jgi:hypothetical protein